MNTEKQENADARLITELLDALKACAAVCAGETMSKSALIAALEKARAAIAKATDAPSRKGADTGRHGSDEHESGVSA